MKWDYADRRRRERRYRLVFRGSLITLAVGLTLALVGFAALVLGADYSMLIIGALLADVSLINGYLALNRTVKILELDTAEATTGISIG